MAITRENIEERKKLLQDDVNSAKQRMAENEKKKTEDTALLNALAGATATADITDLTMTGGDADVNIALEGDTDDHQGGRIVQDTSANENDPIDVEDYTSDIVVYTQAGSSTGTASVLNGVTVAAS